MQVHDVNERAPRFIVRRVFLSAHGTGARVTFASRLREELALARGSVRELEMDRRLRRT